MENHIAIEAFIHIAKKFEKNLPLNLIFGEDWLLRLVLLWFDINKDNNLDFPLSFNNDNIWYAQGRIKGFLPNDFAKTDGMFGDIEKDEDNSYLHLKKKCKKFVVLEAKMQSPYSKKTEHREGYDQVSRTLFCMCHATKTVFEWQWPKIEFNEYLDKFEKIAFYTLLPKENSAKIENLVFNNKNSIKRTITDIIDKSKDIDIKYSLEYLNNYLFLFLEKTNIEIITWEEIIDFIIGNDNKYGNSLLKFYKYCKKFN